MYPLVVFTRDLSREGCLLARAGRREQSTAPAAAPQVPPGEGCTAGDGGAQAAHHLAGTVLRPVSLERIKCTSKMAMRLPGQIHATPHSVRGAGESRKAKCVIVLKTPCHGGQKTHNQPKQTSQRFSSSDHFHFTLMSPVFHFTVLFVEKK